MRRELYDENGALLTVEETPATSEDVNRERDRRQAAGFHFAGRRFQSDPLSRENIAGAVQIATQALVLGGAPPGDLRWHGGDADFTWVAEDNSEMPMDAPTMIAFGQAAAAHHERVFRAARALKNMDPVPADYAADAWWP